VITLPDSNELKITTTMNPSDTPVARIAATMKNIPQLLNGSIPSRAAEKIKMAEATKQAINAPTILRR
jgi:hypothetical protein